MRKNTILVVDDRDDDLVLLKRMFKKAGLLNELQAVSTISDAMSYLEGKGRYSDREKFPFPILMLLDMHLPDGSAFNLLNWLSQKHGRSPAAVVVLTGSDVGAIRQSYELGAHSFLTKPLRFEDFQHMVAHVRGIKLTSTSEGSYLEAD